VSVLATKADYAHVKFEQKVLHQTIWFDSSFKKLLRRQTGHLKQARLEKSTSDKRLHTLEADELMLK
jgi:hypothetical protein